MAEMVEEHDLTLAAQPDGRRCRAARKRSVAAIERPRRGRVRLGASPSPAYIRRVVNNSEPTPAETKFCRELSAAAIATGLDDNTGLFALDSAFRRLAISHATFFGAARALLLQIAHPVVAQGVHDHSDYARSPLARAFRTFLGILAVTLGRQRFALRLAARVFRAHIPVRGTIPSDEPGVPDRSYSAMDPEATTWVWATLVEGILFGRREVLAVPPHDELERMYEESKLFALSFNVRAANIPPTLTDFEAYFADMLERGLHVTPAGQRVAESLVSGARFPLTLFGWLFRSLAVEGLPGSTRAAFGWTSTPLSRTVYGVLRGFARLYYAVMPRFMEVSPIVFYPALRRRLGGPGEPLAPASVSAP